MPPKRIQGAGAPRGVPKSRERRGGRKPQPQKRRFVVPPKSKRPPRRKGETWRQWWARWTRGRPIPILDPVCSWTSYFLAPTSTPWPSDPRRRSRNVGHLVDGVTGWVADVAGHVPVVGNAARPVVRIAANIVRGAEDIVNMVTSPLGFSLFILSLLSVVGAVSHWCPDSEQVTNCCVGDEISFCTESLCWHQHGCVPCTAEGCWTPVGVTWSVKNATDRVDLWAHIDIVAGAIYACDVLDLGEVCAGAAVLAEATMETLQYHHDFTCNQSCFLFVTPTEKTLWFFEFVSADWTWLRMALSVVEGAPRLLSHMLSGGPTISALVLLAYAINGHTTKAIVLLFLLSYAEGLPFFHMPNRTCSTINDFEGTALCFTPVPFIVQEGHFLPKHTRGCVWTKDQTVKRGYNWTNPYGRPIVGGGFNWKAFADAMEALFSQLSLAGGFPNDTLQDVAAVVNITGLVAGAPRERDSCYVPTRRRRAGGCTGWYGNMSAGESWEECGTGMWLTRCAVVWTVFTNSSWPSYPAWAHGLRYRIAVNPSDYCKTLNWTLRLPGEPEVESFYYAVRPANHHFAIGEAASGYLQFTTDGTRQVISGGGVLSPFPHVHDSVLLFCFCVLVRSKYITLLLGIYLCFTSADALVLEAVAPAMVTAQSPWLAPLAVLCHDIGATCLLLAMIPWLARSGCLHYVGIALLMLVARRSEALAYSGEVASYSTVWIILAVVWLLYPLQKRHRASAFWSVRYLRGRLYHHVEGYGLRKLDRKLCICACLFPQATYQVLGSVVLACAVVETALMALEDLVLCKSTPRRVSSLLTSLYRLFGGRAIPVMLWLLEKAGDRGIWLYKHLNDLDQSVLNAIEEFAVWSDPLMLHETEVKIISDSAREMACGDSYNGLPVVARLGELVMCGWNGKTNMKGWRLTAPFRADMIPHTGWFKTVALSIHGTDPRTHSGQIAVLGTGLKSSMGFGFSGALVTTYHSSKGKQLASTSGQLMPLAVNATDDTAVYPLPAGMTCLEACNCGATEAWVLDRHGGLHRGELKGGEVVLTAPVPLSHMRGASGSPVMCKMTHVIGVLRSVKHIRGSAGRVCYTPIDKTTTLKMVVPDSQTALPPAVPKNYEVRVLHAPTGTGKTTKVPMGYVQEGYKVLVLNPSVATTLSMGPYMQKAYNIAPSVYTGETSIGTGTKLTYATYGKAAAMDTSLLSGYDVVICDECHDVTATTILGIGHVLTKAESCGVKLVILATATPPGCSTTPHPNITEVELGSSGEVQFYGKRLELAHYLKGRHLIFCASKLVCDTLASLLRQHGITAVAYYRGEPVSKIPDAGDVVVVATDALMTGYTGNFDSVTDCNLAVVQDLTVDLNPTFSVAVRTVQADAVTRIQRRGRTGRGKPGIYRYVDKGEACSGIVSEAAVVEAFDQAYAWLRAAPAETKAMLAAYSRQPGLPVINADLDMWEQFYQCLHPDPGLLEKIKARADSFATITAMQWTLSSNNHAPLPGTEGRWQGGRYKTGKCPLICHLDCDKAVEWTDEDPFIQQLSQCLGLDREEQTDGWSVVIAGGVMMGLAVLIDSTAALVVTGHVAINSEYVNTLPPEVLFELEPTEAEECGFDLVTAKTNFTELVTKLREQANNYLVMARTSAQPVAAPSYWEGILNTLTTWAADICAAGGVALGLATIRNNAPLACVHAFTAGLVSTLPLAGKTILALAAGAVASTLTTSKPSCAFTVSAIVGGGVAALSVGSILSSIFTGYAGATAGANVAFQLLQGKLPTLEDLTGLLAGVFNPGSVVAGMVAAVILKKGIADRNADWMNRLLAMLSKTNVVPTNYFLDSQPMLEKIEKMLRAVTPIQLFKALTDWLERPEAAECAGGFHLGGLLRALTTLTYRLLSGIVCWIKSHLPYPSIGMLSCDVPYRGEWSGKGTVVTKCGCGKKNTYRIDSGYVTPAAVAKTCWSFWTGGVPINGSTVFKGCAPTPSHWSKADVCVQWGDWYRVERRMGSYYITGVHPQVLDVDLRPPRPTDISYADDSRCAQHAGERPTYIKDYATICGVEVTLPITIEKLATLVKQKKEDAAKNVCEKKVFGLTLTPFCEHEENTILKEMMKYDREKNPTGPAQQMQPTPGVHAKPEVAGSASSGFGGSLNEFIHETLPEPPRHVDVVGVVKGAAEKVAEWIGYAPTDAAAVVLGRHSPDEFCRSDGVIWKAVSGKTINQNKVTFKPLTVTEDTPSTSDKHTPSTTSLDTPAVDFSDLPPLEGDSTSITFGADNTSLASELTLHSRDGAVVGHHAAALTTAVPVESRTVAQEEGFYFNPAFIPAPFFPTTEEAAVKKEEAKHQCSCGKEFLTIAGQVACSLSHPQQAVQVLARESEVFYSRGRMVRHTTVSVAPKVRVPLLPLQEDIDFAEGLFDQEGDWETSSETSCNYSYIWNNIPISTRQIGKKPLPIRYLSSGLGRFRQLVYWSEPAQAEERKAKVTYFREAEVDAVLEKVRDFAIRRASRVREGGLSFDEAALLTPPHSATSCLSGLTASQVRARTSKARRLCEEAYQSIGDPTSKYCMVTVMPKVEIFVKTPEKPTTKPPRLIAYPPLEMRVAEKMVLGKVGPAAVKAVLGNAYGFQYTPWERARKLVEWWEARKSPMAFACDTICFDSTVTAADVAFESKVYAASCKDPALAGKIFGLGNTLYTTSPMYSQTGQLLGVRQCRASGVFTTSSSNCLTAYTKARAAAVHAGISNPQFLVHGDDIICICDASPTVEEDRQRLATFAVWMKKYGCPQGQVPYPCYSLEEVESCSSNVSSAKDLLTGKPYYYLTRDPVVPLGRAMAEAVDRTVSQTWIGNLLLHYPALWASRVLMVHLLDQIDTLNDVTDLTINIWGTEYTIDLTHLPYLIDKLHGEGARRLAYFTPAEVARVSARLKTLGYPPLRAWKAKAKIVRVRLLRRGGKFAYLAKHLLWFAAGRLPPPLDPVVKNRIDFKLPSFSSPDGYIRQSADLVSISGNMFAVASSLLVVSVLLTLALTSKS
nr:polyprotein [Rodent hepacivirus]